jgi:LuxR family maltose regulon positive regulatory protein
MLRISKLARLPLGLGWAHYGLGMAAFEMMQVELALQHLAYVLDAQYAASLRGVFDSYFMAVILNEMNGQPARADALLSDANELATNIGAPRNHDDVRSLRIRLALMRGDVERASLLLVRPVSTEVQLRNLVRSECHELSTVRALVAVGGREELATARRLLDNFFAFVRSVHNPRFETDALLVQALLLQRLGRDDQALASLEQSLALAEPRGYLRPFVEMAQPLVPYLTSLRGRNVAPRFVARVLERLPSAGRPTMATLPLLAEPLTNREMDVLELLAERLSNQEIADRLVVSTNTVRAHVSNITQKLGVSGRREAVLHARSIGLLP